MAFSRISSRPTPVRRPAAQRLATLLLAAACSALAAPAAARQRPAASGETPRRALLVLVDGTAPDAPRSLGGNPEAARLRTPLQHLGVEILEHAAGAAAPAASDPGLADVPILVWIDGGAAVPPWLPGWLLDRAARQRVVLLGDPDRLDAADPVAAAQLWRRLGFECRAGFVDDPLRIDVELAAPGVGWFESAPRRSPLHRGTRSVDTTHRVWVRTVDRRARDDRDPTADGDRRDHVVTGRFGGLARQPFLLEPGDARLAPRWHVDPLRFFAAALGLEGAPVPDPHVVHGRRVLHVSVGSEGLLGRSTFDGAAPNVDVLLDRLLDAHRLPVTVSVDATALQQLAPTERDELVRSLRRLAARPFVEFALECSTPAADDGLAATQPDDHARTAALDTARRALEATLGRRVHTATWRLGSAGDGDLRRPTELARCLQQLGLTPTPVTPFRRDLLHPSLLDVPPLGWTTTGLAPLAALRAPLEALYPQFYGELPGAFRHAATTLLATDRPSFRIAAALRAQFHTAERPARLAAFDRLLRDWTAEHDTCVLFTDQHLAAVRELLDPDRCRSVRVGAEGWDFRGFDTCRTLRFDGDCPPIDWDRSPGVVGARRIDQTLWVGLGSPDAALRWQDPRRPSPSRPHLEQADRPLRAVQRDAAGITCEFDPRTGPPTALVVAGFPADTALRWSLQPDGAAQGLRSDALGRVHLALQNVWTTDAAGDGPRRRLRIEVAP